MNDIFAMMGLEKDSKLTKLYQQEKLIVEVTEVISQLMKSHNISKAALAKRMNTTKSNVTQLLDGSTNMTLRTISDILWALDSKFVVHAIPTRFSDNAAGIWQSIDALLSQAKQYKPGPVSTEHKRVLEGDVLQPRKLNLGMVG